MMVVRALLASLACMFFVVPAKATDLATKEARARDFSFQGVPFGCTIEQFKTRYPTAELVPDPTGTWRSVGTRHEKKFNAVRYEVKQNQRDGEGVPRFQFRRLEYLFIDDRMVEFQGTDFMSDPDASRRYFKLYCDTLGDPAEEHSVAGEGMELTWRFPNVRREFIFSVSELAGAAIYLGRDTAAISTLERKRAGQDAGR